MLRARGLEPPRVAPYGPEPYASANSATRAKRQRPYDAHERASRKAKINLPQGTPIRCLIRLGRTFLAGTNFQLMRFAYLTQRPQKVGVIRHDSLVILGGFFTRLLPNLKRIPIKLSRFGVVTTGMIDHSKIAF